MHAKQRQDNPDREYVFVNAAGNALTSNKVNEALAKICKACGVRYLSTHKERFWCCSKMYESMAETGIAEMDIQRAMNHRDIATTRHYNRTRQWGMSERADAAILKALN
ncbi:MAG: tyrosine-type recombinase/integrase [Lachnospiraceae bacterium]|nr:tyrosine-type recombinase/integrase [Lachnospiraceae bacterium]